MNHSLDENGKRHGNLQESSAGSVEQNQMSQEMDRLKEIPKWARRYALNKTMSMVVMFMIFLLSFAVVSAGVHCFLNGNPFLGWVMIGVFVMVFICSFSVEKYCKTHCYEQDGMSKSERVEEIKKFLALPLVILAGFSIYAMKYFNIPMRLSMPISATYVCPLLAYVNWRWARYDSFIGYLWAGLYGAWATAILLNVPLLTFAGRWEGQEMYITVSITGLIAALAAHLYNRYALRKLKKLTNVEQDGGVTNEKA